MPINWMFISLELGDTCAEESLRDLGREQN